MRGVVRCWLAERAEMPLQSCDWGAGELYGHGCRHAGGVAREIGARTGGRRTGCTVGEHNMRREVGEGLEEENGRWVL